MHKIDRRTLFKALACAPVAPVTFIGALERMPVPTISGKEWLRKKLDIIFSQRNNLNKIAYISHTKAVELAIMFGIGPYAHFVKTTPDGIPFIPNVSFSIFNYTNDKEVNLRYDNQVANIRKSL